jgi:hypothetical protein
MAEIIDTRVACAAGVALSTFSQATLLAIHVTAFSAGKRTAMSIHRAG